MLKLFLTFIFPSYISLVALIQDKSWWCDNKKPILHYMFMDKSWWCDNKKPILHYMFILLIHLKVTHQPLHTSFVICLYMSLIILHFTTHWPGMITVSLLIIRLPGIGMRYENRDHGRYLNFK